MTDAVEGRAPTIGSKLIGIHKPQVPCVANKGVDSSSRIIISKVLEILLSCKEMKSRGGDDDGMSRPELSSKWISLLAMEKACLSAVSFEDTSETVRKGRGNFEERLRELGGLDAIFDVVVRCHSNMEDHLLGMRRKVNSEGLSMSFVKVVISCIKFLSGLALLQSLSHICKKGKSTCLSENVDSYCNHASVMVKENKRGKDGSTWQVMLHVGGIGGLKERNRTCHKREKLLASPSELSDCGSEMSGAFGSDFYSFKNKTVCNGSNLCGGTLSGSNGGACRDTKVLKLNVNANGLKLNASTTSLKVKSDDSGKHEHGWISIRATGSKTTDSCKQPKRSHMSEDVEDEHPTDSFDPFAFDEGEFEPSKWDKLSRKKESSHSSKYSNQ